MLENSLPIPEVYGTNPVIGKIYVEHLLTVNCFEKTKRRKEAGNGTLNTVYATWLIISVYPGSKFGLT